MSITLDRTEPVLATGDWNVVLVPAGQRAPGNAKPLPVANEDTIHVYIAAHAGKPGFSEHGQHWGSIDLATAIDRAHRGAAWIPYGGSKELVVTANDFRAIRDWALGNHAAGGIGRAYFAHREREVRFTNYGAGRRFNALLRAHLARYEALLDCGYDEDPGAAFAAFAHDVGVIDDDARANRHALGVFDGLGDAQWDAAAKLFGEAANR